MILIGLLAEMLQYENVIFQDQVLEEANVFSIIFVMLNKNIFEVFKNHSDYWFVTTQPKLLHQLLVMQQTSISWHLFLFVHV